MENRWREQEAEHLAPLERLVYMTRLVGAEPRLVQWGAGNSSLKWTEQDFRGEDVPVLRVKATGAAMASIDASGFAGVRLDVVLPLRERDAVDDAEVSVYLRHALMEPEGPRPSIETLLHAFIPHAVVLHSHAEPVLALANAAESARHIAKLFRGRVFAVEYRRSGFPLAKAVWEGLQKSPRALGAILLHHGMVTWGESCKEAYDRHIRIASLAEKYVESRRKLHIFVPAAAGAGPADQGARGGSSARWGRDSPGERAGRGAWRSALAAVLPSLRAKLFPSGQGVLCYDESPEILAFLELPQAADWVKEGPATPDHIVHTKRWPCFVPPPAEPDPAALWEAIDQALESYAAEYRRCASSRLGTEKIPRDPYPRVLLIPGAGMVTAGRDWTEATAARDLYRQTLRVIEAALGLGGYRALGDDDAFELEFWPLVLLAYASRRPKGELDGKIALVAPVGERTGRATARRLLEEGAHVVVADPDERTVRSLEGELAAEFGGRCRGVVMALRDEEQAKAALQEAVLCFGGLDVLVLNGGDIPLGVMNDPPLALREHSLPAEARGQLALLRAAAQVMQARGGGAFVLQLGEGAAARPSAVGEGERLVRALAAEHGGAGIRVNAVRTGALVPGEEEWPFDRAAPRKMLEEEYRRTTLLRTVVHPEDVAECIFFLASDRSAKMTGCVLTVDAGLREASEQRTSTKNSGG